MSNDAVRVRKDFAGVLPHIPVWLLPAVFYVNGEAFHDAYLSYFHLEPSLFAMDVQATFTQAVIAWTQGILLTLSALPRGLEQHWLTALALFIICALSLAGYSYLQDRGSGKTGANEHKAQQKRRPFLLAIGKAAGAVGLGLYGLYVSLLAAVLLLVLIISPFNWLGKHVASRDAATNFRNAAAVTLRSPDGAQKQYKIIECYGGSCALYRNGTAVAVPRSLVTWVVPVPPDPPRPAR